MTDQNNLPAFKKLIKENNLDGFIVTNPINIFYLTGFKGVLPQERESILVFNPSATLITAMIYQNEARRIKTKNLKVKIVNERNQILDFAKTLLSQKHPRGVENFHLGGEIRSKDRKIGFEEEDLKFSEHKLLTSNQKPESRNEFIPCKNLIEDLRQVKTEDEVKRIEKAQIISQNAFKQLVKTVKIGQTEEEIAHQLTQIIKSLGADSLAFESIVASGRNAGLPHYATGRKKIKKGQVLLLDFGAKYQNYCADLSRTIFIGRVPNHQKNIYQAVANAQKAVIKKITHGLKASEAYHSANDLFKKQGLHQYFLHGLGHGIGLDVHETPHLRSDLPTTNDQLLTNGMVFSVEPGLYFPWGGIRIEDLVVIENGRAKVLGKLNEEIIEV